MEEAVEGPDKRCPQIQGVSEIGRQTLGICSINLEMKEGGYRFEKCFSSSYKYFLSAARIPGEVEEDANMIIIFFLILFFVFNHTHPN